jgi:hypothetical protein
MVVLLAVLLMVRVDGLVGVEEMARVQVGRGAGGQVTLSHSISPPTHLHIEYFMYQRRVLCTLNMALLISKLFCRRAPALSMGGGGGASTNSKLAIVQHVKKTTNTTEKRTQNK